MVQVQRVRAILDDIKKDIEGIDLLCGYGKGRDIENKLLSMEIKIREIKKFI